MTPSANLQRAAIKELIGAGLYVVDAASVANAIVTRCLTRHLVAGATFRSEARVAPLVRSFRRSEQARSFRPCGHGPRTPPRR